MDIFAFTTEPSTAFFIAMFPLAIWMVVARPAAWPIIFLCMSAFRLPDAFPIIRPLSFTLYSGFFSIFTLFWHGVLARTLKIAWRPELIAMLAVFAAALLSAVLPFSRSVAIEALTGSYWKIIATTLTLAYLLRSVEDFRALVVSIVASGALLSLVAFHNKYYGIDLVEETRVGIGGEFKSPIADPNDLALVLLSPLSFTIAFALQRRNWVTTLSMVLLSATILYAIILTQSRGGILGLLAILGVIGLSYVRSKSLILALSIGAGLALFTAMGIAARRSGGFEDIAEGGGIDESSYLRIIAWQAALNMIAARPLTGVGISNFVEAFYLYTPVWPGRALSPHSSWFGVAAEVGILGLAAFVTMIVLAFRTLNKVRSRLSASDHPIFMSACSLGLKASLVGFVVGGSFLGQHFTWNVYTLVALASAMGAYAAGTVPIIASGLSQSFSTRPPDRALAARASVSQRTSAS